MPRDIVLLTPQSPTVSDILNAARDTDRTLSPVISTHGAITSLLLPDQTATLTLQYPIVMDHPHEIERLLPDAAGRVSVPVFWSEGWAPWGSAGVTGVRIARLLAERLDGICVVEEGA